MTPASATANAPIGVFDSGVGGLSVLREIHHTLPAEALLYVADSGHAPYGDKPPDHVQHRAEQILDFFTTQHCKAVVVACNTVTGLSISHLRSRHPQLPIVAIEPAVKPAAALTRTGTFAVLATRNTIQSPGLARLIQSHAQGAHVLLQPCPGWVELVERGELDSPETRAAVARYVEPLLAQGADTLVLGCTHYPFLAHVIRDIAGPHVQVLDPAAAVARELQRRLAQRHLLQPPESAWLPAPTLRCWTSGEPAHAERVVQALWGSTVPVQALPAGYSTAALAAL